MRVVVPYVLGMLDGRVLPAIRNAGYRAEARRVEGDDGYFELFAELWSDGRDFALVEQDVEVAPFTLDGLWRCGEPWCAHSYEVFAGDIAEVYGGPFGLGCVRFRAELMAELPTLPADVGASTMAPQYPPRHWATLDSTVTGWLKGPYNRRVCHHQPNVTHHHHYDRVGAYVPQPGHVHYEGAQ